MICQNCQATVDNDLIFCTNCGERLSETKSNSQTVLLKDSVITKNSLEKPPPSSSNLKWLALIVALFAIPASIFGVYLLTNQNRPQVSKNTNKPNLTKPTATPKANSNQNSTANISNSNNEISNENANTAESNAKIEVMNERIEIAPKEHYTVPFAIEKENIKLVGEAKLLEGEKITGFVYLQKSYDEYFPDPIYKMFSFEGRKSAEIKAALVEEKYVLIFVNDTDKPMVIQGNFSLE